MFALVIFAFVAVSQVASYGVTVGITPYSHPVQSQYHSQDELGQYVYGYATPTATKSEAKTVDGVTRGGYSYIDSFGILQTVHYISDPINGFRVAATNLPRDLPEVAYAKASHLAQVEATRAEHAAIAANVVQYSNPIAVPISSVHQVPLEQLPVPVQDLPEVVKARAEHLAFVDAVKARDFAIAAEQSVNLGPVPQQLLAGAVVPVKTNLAIASPAVAAPVVSSYAHTTPLSYVPASSQYHSQDEIGQYSYGYTGPHSSKAETKTADGITRGGYSYIDANGIVQTVHYISDPVNGFRVAATNLPVGPDSQLYAARPVGTYAPVAPVAPVEVVKTYSAPVEVVNSYAAPAVVNTAPVEVVKTVHSAPLYEQDIYY